MADWLTGLIRTIACLSPARISNALRERKAFQVRLEKLEIKFNLPKSRPWMNVDNRLARLVNHVHSLNKNDLQ